MDEMVSHKAPQTTFFNNCWIDVAIRQARDVEMKGKLGDKDFNEQYLRLKNNNGLAADGVVDNPLDENPATAVGVLNAYPAAARAQARGNEGK